MSVRSGFRVLGVASIALVAHSVFAAYEVQITKEQRDRFLKAATVWQQPRSDDMLSADPNGAQIVDRLDCQAVPYQFPGGKTPKFLCAVLDKNGKATDDVVKVKYGLKNTEIAGEVAGENLLRHLGFGGDHMQIVRVLVCYGSECPPGDGPTPPIQPPPAQSKYEILSWVSIERRMEGHELLGEDKQGFRIGELASIPRTGENKAQADALFLLLAFVNHADSKPDNQRLMCLPDHMDEQTKECKGPFAMVHDAGSFFGSGVLRKKVDLSAWRSVKVFAKKDCTVEVRSSWAASAFPAIKISEQGRQFLLQRLKPMVDSSNHNQIRNLFTSAHMDMDPGSTIDGWVTTFIDKVHEIEMAGPCE